MISLEREYRTAEGYRVRLWGITLHNSAGREVTFPVKGTIYEPGKRPRYQIWTLNGKADVIKRDSADDLVDCGALSYSLPNPALKRGPQRYEC